MAKDPHRPLDYLVLPVAALRAVTGGLPADTLGILLQLLLRCAVELNSGRIEHAAATTQAPHCNIPGLWHWEGSTLVLDIYPAEYEAKALAKRYNYAANAGERWKKQASIQKEPNAIASPEQCHCIQKTPLLHTPDMQLHQESCNCMQSYMQFPRAHAGDNHNIFNNGGDSAHAHTRESSAPQPAPVVPTTPPPLHDKTFETWWRLIAATHPSGKLMRQLPDDIRHAAWSAYQTIPAAEDYAALLEAYMSDKLQKNKYGERFYRASGVARYFDTLADHINHAERWAVETGFHRKKTTITRDTAAGIDKAPAEGSTPASEADIAAFLADIQQFKDTGAPTHSNHDDTTNTEQRMDIGAHPGTTSQHAPG